MALAHSLEQSADARLKGANETAQVFRLLNTHGSEFTPEESDAYNKLRDAVMGISGESPDTYMKVLAKYLDAVPSTEASAVTPASHNENAVAETSEAAAPVIPPLTFMSRERIGTQFNAPTPMPVPEQKEVPAVTQLEVRSEMPKEEPKAEADLQVLSEPSAPEVVAAIQEKVAEVATPSVEQPANIEAAAKEIESINEDLNEFGGWKALSWINNPQTGYKDYMRKLIAVRGAIADARSGKANPDLAALTAEVRTLAEGVRAAVKGIEGKDTDPVAKTPVVEAAAAAPMPTEAVAPMTPMSAPTSVSLKVESAVPEVATWSHSTEESQAAPVAESVAAPVAEQSVAAEAPRGVENIAAALGDMPTAPVEAEPLNIHELPRATAPVAEQVMPAAPVPEMPAEVPAPAAEADLSVLAEPAASVAEVMQEQTATPVTLGEKPAPNPEIYSPKVEEELNSLLTKWLGSDGWLIKKSGVEHPDWQKMATLTVGEVIDAAQKGENRPGLEATMISNLADNLKKWGELYGISMLQHEDTTIDEMMHRVVFEYLKP